MENSLKLRLYYSRGYNLSKNEGGLSSFELSTLKYHSRAFLEMHFEYCEKQFSIEQKTVLEPSCSLIS
jgi:hypothetical protein